MGWRAWDNYDQEARKNFRALPSGERYRWRGVLIFAAIVAFAGAYVLATIRI